MLYTLAHILRDKCPWIWEAMEGLNSILFSLLYGRKLKRIDKVLENYQNPYLVQSLKENDLKALVQFFDEQPESAFEYFKPHDFDAKTLKILQKRKSFLTFVVKQNDIIVGYFFLRCYFIGKCFRGYIVDYKHQNLGISKYTAKVMTDIVRMLGIPSYGTIAPDNIASLKSQNAKIIKQLKNGDYYVKYDY